MPIRELRVAGYRSIRDLTLPLGPVNVLTGPNGCGKSNLYRAMFLLARAAEGGFGPAIAGEGGMPSVLWAGREKVRLTRRAKPRRVVLSFAMDDYSYELQFGLPASGTPSIEPSMFLLDPEVKAESVWIDGPRGRRVALMERDHSAVSMRDAEGRMAPYPLGLYKSESVLSQIREPHLYPELASLSAAMRQWRFYHQFRTDPDSPIRQPQIGVMTPVLGHEGGNLAAALQTIVEIGAARELEEAIDRAFPGARLEIASERTRFRLLLHMPGVLRPLEGPEFSDGTLRYLCLVAALLSPRPPALLALNEPETSIHPDLLAPLARLVANAARDSQFWITTHSRALAEEVERLSGHPPVALRMDDGETRLA